MDWLNSTTSRRKIIVLPTLFLASLFLMGCGDEESHTVRQSFETTCGNTAYSYTSDSAVDVRITVKNHSTSACNLTMKVFSDEQERASVSIVNGTSATVQRSDVNKLEITCDAGGGDCKGSFTVEFL